MSSEKAKTCYETKPHKRLDPVEIMVHMMYDWDFPVADNMHHNHMFQVQQTHENTALIQWPTFEEFSCKDISSINISGLGNHVINSQEAFTN
jgi:hypothetical protein